MDQRQAYQEKLEAQLKQWTSEAQKFGAKLKEATADARIEGQKQLDQLKEKQVIAEKKLAQLRSAGADQFEKIKADMEASWTDLRSAFDRARSRIMH